MKKAKIILLAILMIFVSFSISKVDAYCIGLDEEERLQRIDELYERRNVLCLDYEKNEREIEFIDREISLLGVKEYSLEEIGALLTESVSVTTTGRNSINVDVSDTETTKWTGTETVYSFNGTSYELLIVYGTNKKGINGKLYKTWTSVASKSNFVANAVKTIKLVITAASGSPTFPNALSVGMTFYDVFSQISELLNPTTTITNFSCTYVGTVNNSIKYVFVKNYGDPDGSPSYGQGQILCYYGNSIAYQSAELAGAMVAANGVDLIPNSEKTEYVSCTIRSGNYDNAKYVACARFVQAQSVPYSQVVTDYSVEYIKEYYINNTSKSISVPFDSPVITY